MNRIKIGIDLDSVLNNLLPYWLDIYNKDYNDNLKSSDITTWETNLFVKKECGKKIYDYLLKPNFFRNIPVIENSQNVVEWLFTFDEVELYVVTAYVPESCLDKVNWLKEHFPFIDSKNIVFCNNKSLIDIDYLIDDSPYNFIGFKGMYLLMDEPYNQNIRDSTNILRLNNWLDVKEYFKKVLKEI